MDEKIEALLKPIADGLHDFIFFSIDIAGAELPLIVVWLVAAAVFFTVYFKFINISGFKHAIRLVRGDFDDDDHGGEISHFQALTTALSGTVGIGNIAGVAVLISLGGPGAAFWLILAGFLGMSTKFVECTLGVMFRKTNPDGSISGGPMYYLERGLKARGMNTIAKPLGIFYAISIVIGCLGIGNMFQSNQAFETFIFVTGGEASEFLDKGWLFGIVIAVMVGLVILGGLKSIAQVTGKLVPFMAVLYFIFAIIIIIMNGSKVPAVVGSIFTEAFSPIGMSTGMIGVMILGFQRAVFSNEAGIGSAAIAHSAVKTNEPITEGYVALLEPFIDTVVICTLTALLILTTVYDPAMATEGVQGIQLTASAFEQNISWSVIPLAVIAILFAFSTMISWAYYGMKAWTYLVGESKSMEIVFKVFFCVFAVIGCIMKLDSVLDFSDSMVFLVSLPNIIGLYLLAPLVKKELASYRSRHQDRFV